MFGVSCVHLSEGIAAVTPDIYGLMLGDLSHEVVGFRAILRMIVHETTKDTVKGTYSASDEAG